MQIPRVSAAARAIASLRNFVLRRLIFVKPEIQIYQHTGNRLMDCYSLAIWAAGEYLRRFECDTFFLG